MTAVLRSGSEFLAVMAEASGRVMVGRSEVRIENFSRNGGTLAGTLGGTRWKIEVARIGDRIIAWSSGRIWQAEIQLLPVSEIDAAGEHSGQITAPMPGSIVQVHVSPSQPVAAGDVMVTIESMKMETALVAIRDGVVASVLVEAGTTVDRGALLVSFMKQEEAAS
ncbi:MAG: biotin/lipoyl-containing protein [Hyphomicrobiaceae bacterium]